ncbi:calcium-binding protein [Tatumella citrea]|nr:calcium-binding protein [Tatumella citrea]
MNIAGKNIPVAAVALSAAGLLTDFSSMARAYESTGKINTSDIYSALGNVASVASAIALAAAAGAASAPVALGAAGGLTVLAAVLSIASMAAKGSIDPGKYMDNIRDALKPLSDALGDAYDNAIENLSDMVDSAANAFDALTDYMNDAMESLANFARSLFEDPARDAANNAADQAAAAAEDAANQASPLIVDLDGDGVETAESPVYFDHDGNGYAQLSGWVGRDDGLLVLDRNGNHIIDDGSELFGNNTVSSSGETANNGFLALADYDSNGDGMISSKDDIFTRLQIWQDRNGNGVTDEGELFSLEQAGIAAIQLNWSNSKVTDEYGNEFRQQGQYIKTDGSLAEIVDVWFRETRSNTLDKHKVAVSDDIASLPDITATGNVSNLHQLIARGDHVLRDLVEQFIQQPDQQLRFQLTDKIMRQMSGAINYTEDSRGAFISGQKLFALEAFLGSEFRQNGHPAPLSNAAQRLESAYDILLNNIYAQLTVQTHLAPLIEQVNWQIENQQIVADTSTLIRTLREGINQSDLAARDQLVDLLFVVQHLDSDFTRQLTEQLSMLSNAEGDAFERILDIFMPELSAHQVIGNFGDDTLSAGEIASVMYGLDGNDTLTGSKFTDTLYGNKGDDYLNGSYGNDLYIYTRGDGHDTIMESSFEGTDDRLWLKDITASQVTVSRDGADILLTIAESSAGAADGGSVRLVDQAASGKFQTGVEWLEFADGTRWNQQQLREQMFATAITPGDDRITGSNMDDRLQGGHGDDYLNGSYGNDLYIYARGDGHDTIMESSFEGTDDRLWLKDITASQVTVSRDGADMLLTIAESSAGAADGGSVRLVDQAESGKFQTGVEWVDFANGLSWNTSMLSESSVPEDCSFFTTPPEITQGYEAMYLSHDLI